MLSSSFHGLLSSMYTTSFQKLLLVLTLHMVDKSTRPSKPTAGRFLVMRQSRQAFSAQSKAPSEPFCGYLHPSPWDIIQHPCTGYLGRPLLERKKMEVNA